MQVISVTRSLGIEGNHLLIHHPNNTDNPLGLCMLLANNWDAQAASDEDGEWNASDKLYLPMRWWWQSSGCGRPQTSSTYRWGGGDSLQASDKLYLPMRWWWQSSGLRQDLLTDEVVVTVFRLWKASDKLYLPMRWWWQSSGYGRPQTRSTYRWGKGGSLQASGKIYLPMR